MLWNSSTGCFRQQKYAQVQKAVRFMEENQFQCYETERYLLWAAQLHTYKDRRWMGKNPCQLPCCYPSILLWPWSGRGWWTRGISGLIKCISPYIFFLSMLVGWITVCLLPFVFCINHKLHPEVKWPCSSYCFWDGGWEELLEIYVLTQVSVQRGDGGCWAAQCLHSPAYRARLVLEAVGTIQLHRPPQQGALLTKAQDSAPYEQNVSTLQCNTAYGRWGAPCSQCEVCQDELQVTGWGFTNWSLHIQATAS